MEKNKKLKQLSHKDLTFKWLMLKFTQDLFTNEEFRNGRMNPTLSTLEKIANALGISTSELLK